MEYEEIKGKKYPVMWCKLNRYGQWFFYCPYCKKNHYHGPVEGHRSSHCYNEASPYYRSGYIIKLPKYKSASNPDQQTLRPIQNTIEPLDR